jgi:aryl-alcohol dehydrogenase-like predicted oxidoreductase
MADTSAATVGEARGGQPGSLEQRQFVRLAQSGAAHSTASVVGVGCWQLGGDWGGVSDEDANRLLHAAFDIGITFYDTADVYGAGRSETRVAKFRNELSSADADRLLIATKIGRRADPFISETYTEKNLRYWLDDSRKHLQTDRLDLVQLHCPPSDVYDMDEVFDVLDAAQSEGIIAGYGVSVETCEEALKAISRPGVTSLQIILNAFRLKPLEQVLPKAAEAGVGVIARVPLASGLLSGKYTKDTTFGADDHRNFNRHGESFDVGETFSGVPYETGLTAVKELKDALPEGVPLPQAALRWIIDQPGLTTVIPGARNAQQVERNAAAGASELPSGFDAAVRRVYDKYLRELIHTRW